MIYQELNLAPHLTVEENLKVGAHMRKFGRSVKDGLDMVYHYFPRLQALPGVAKSAINGDQKMALAKELGAVHTVKAGDTVLFHAAAGDNVLVNSVCPGWVRTEMGGKNAVIIRMAVVLPAPFGPRNPST